MKTPSNPTGRIRYILLLAAVLTMNSIQAQVQWYQNQDGQNHVPDGTFAGSVKSFTTNTFVACYRWQTSGDQYTWKISKSNQGGTELKTFLLSGTTAAVEIKANRNGTVYALKRDYPLGQNPVYVIYKLNSNLEVMSQYTINLPGGFIINTLNAFETDADANIYIAGDGQYPDGPGYSPASFFTRLDRNLSIRWTKMQPGTTSFTQVKVDPSGRVWLIEDYYSFFPDVYIRKYSANGILLLKDTISTSPLRYDLSSQTDGDGNLYLYGNSGVGDTAQGMYLYKLNRTNGQPLYSKTLLPAPGFQLFDLLIDNNDRIFTSAWRYLNTGGQETNISRINAGTGNITWSQHLSYEQDSLLLYKLVDANDKVYGIGEKRCGAFLSRGQGVSFRKTGQQEAVINGPDSTQSSKSHTLVDGIATINGSLVTIGNTTELDMQTFNSNYYRAFAVSLNNNRCFDRNTTNTFAKGAETEGPVPATPGITVYPNPVSDYFNITGLSDGGYNRVTLYNMLGEQVLQQNISGNTVRLDAGNLKAGTYLATLSSGTTQLQKTIKVIVSR